MNYKRTISFLLCFLIIPLFAIGQNQIKILDDTDRVLGRFKSQLYQINGAKLKQLRGNTPKIEAEAETVELILRLYDLRWFEDENLNNPVEISRTQIKVNDADNIQLSSSKTSFSLKPNTNVPVDIKFKVKANGDYTFSVPFRAGPINGKFAQLFSVEEILANEAISKPIGEIADIKKAWRLVDKKVPEDIEKFLAKYKDNDIAKEEGILIIADRTLKRAQRLDSSDLTDEEAWAEIENSDNAKDLERFLEDYPESKYAEAAKAKLGKDAKVLLKTSKSEREVRNTLTKKESNIFSLDLSNLQNPEIKISHPDEIEIFDNGGNIFELKVKGSRNYTIDVTEESTSNKYTFNLNNEFKAQMDRNGKDFIFSIEGGVAPFTAEFYKIDEFDAGFEARFGDLKPDIANQIIIKHETLRKSGMDGQYEKVVLRDFSTESVTSFPIDISVEPKNTGLRLVLFLLLSAILIGGGAMYFINKRKNETRKEYLAKAKALQQSQKIQQVPNHNIEPEITSSQNPPKKITISKSERKSVPANAGSNFVSSGRMKITKRDVKGGRKTAEEFTEILKGDKYAYMDLQELWPDTAIRELFLSKECIKALGTFLKEENLDKVITEMQGAIPEVGGFLMGYHQLDEATGSIRVTMDQFVPFVPEYHDVFKIEIGTATLVQELGDAQDNHPDKDVIGWFHTHPGHGLFLSNSDLSVQRHFPLKFQIAMEIDSLTETLDTAFFTRKNNGTINNVEHRRKGAKWFSWKKIENI